MAYQSPIIPSLDLTYQYQPLPATGNTESQTLNKGTAWDFFSRDENGFSAFRELIIKAGMMHIFNGLQADMTIFAPKDETLLVKRSVGSIINTTRSEAASIVSYSILPRKITSRDLSSSRCLRLETRNRQEKLNSGVHDNGEIWLDQRVQILKPDLITNNSLIHVTDVLCIPPTLLSNFNASPFY